MKGFVMEFTRRGIFACGIGPIVLAIVYLVLQKATDLKTLSVNQVCVGILSLTALAFIAGGTNAIYQIERLPIMPAILIHGTALYFSYLGVYLLNGWLEQGPIPIVFFSAVFVVGYILIWAIIYSIQRRNTKRLNAALEQQRQDTDRI